jgi:hypothetical protein
MNKCCGEFVAFRTLHEADPMTDEAYELIVRCLEYYLQHCGKPLSLIERFLAQYKIELCEIDELKRKEKQQ